MRILIAVVLLLFAGMVGIIVHHEIGGPASRSAGPLGPVGEKIATISRGEKVEIRPHLTEGHRTLIEFTADW